MQGERVLLGRALVDRPGPLTARDHKGDLVAVCPYGAAYGAGVLGVGPSGAGKTGQLRPMLCDLLRTYDSGSERLEALLCDGKGADSFLMFAGQPGVSGIYTTPDPASGDPDPLPVVVREFHAEIQRRYGQLKRARERAILSRRPLDWRPPSLSLLCIDEYGDWNLGLTPKLRTEMVKLLTRCGQIGREVGCRVWLWMQAPYAKLADVLLPGALKQQLSIRILVSGLVGVSATLAGMIFDDRDAGDRLERYADQAELRGDGRRGLAMVQLGRLEVPFKAPYLADPLHWETTPAEAEAAWRLLPARPSDAEVRRFLSGRAA